MIGALVFASWFAAPPPAQAVDGGDGFYCSTPRYFAYETRLHDSAEPHLLHVISLTDATGTQPERTFPVPPEPAVAMRCHASTVDLRTREGVVSVVVAAPRAGSAARFQTDRLWGPGSWARSATLRTPLQRFGSGRRITLEVIRVSSGGPDCIVTAGARVVWQDDTGQERQARAIFYRSSSCRQLDLTAPSTPAACSSEAGRVTRRVSGRVALNASYRRAIPPFAFELRSEGSWGWRIRVTPVNQDRDLTSLLPLHGASSRDVGNPQAGDDAATGRSAEHPFTFHPEVGRSIRYVDDSLTMLVDDLRVRSYGQGLLTITSTGPSVSADGRSQFSWIAFSACLSFPR